MRHGRVPAVSRVLAVLLCLAMVGVFGVTGSPRIMPHPPPPPDALLPVNYWQKQFDTALRTQAANADRLSRSADSWDHYTLSYSVDELTSMFEATGQRRYVDRAVSYVENVMESARPSSSLPRSDFRDGYLGWASYGNGETGQEVALYESYLWRYVARLLRVMHQSGLDVMPAYRDAYVRTLDFTRRNIVDKWTERGPDDYVFRSRAHMAAHWAMIAVDLAAVVDDPALRSRYREIAHAIDRDLPNAPSSLRGQLRPNPGEPAAYWWSDVWGWTDGAPQDIGHGNGVIAYVVEARDAGSVEWSADDMARFTRTLTAFVIGRDDRYPGYVDGSGRGNGWIADGFVKLGRFDPDVQAMLQDYGVQNMQFYASMAANAFRLLGRS